MTLPKYAPLSLPNFEKNSKFDDMYMCILLKFEYAKFRVSNLFFQKLLKKNLWGGWPVKEELKEMNAERIFRTRFNNTIKYPWKRQLRKVYVLFVATIGCKARNHRHFNKDYFWGYYQLLLWQSAQSSLIIQGNLLFRYTSQVRNSTHKL